MVTRTLIRIEVKERAQVKVADFGESPDTLSDSGLPEISLLPGKYTAREERRIVSSGKMPAPTLVYLLYGRVEDGMFIAGIEESTFGGTVAYWTTLQKGRSGHDDFAESSVILAFEEAGIREAHPQN